jgi:glycosyltransferase involved in cell wall biosynthesis
MVACMIDQLKRLWNGIPPGLRETALRWGSSFRLGSPWQRQDTLDDPVFVLGFFSQASGLGESARLWHAAERSRGTRVYPVDITSCFANPDVRLVEPVSLSLGELKRHMGPARLVLHMNPPRFLVVLGLLGRRFLKNKGIVAYWAWELENLPPLWLFALRYTHEVEVPSTFVAQAVMRHTSNPVRVVPPVVPEVASRSRAFAEDGVTRVLFVFDMGSRIVRKNPFAAIDAFRLAFGDRTDVRFTLKVSNTESDPLSSAILKRHVGTDPCIRILDRTLPGAAMQRLYQDNDIYLSLHRSEGFGLTIREAMSHGMFVVATGWSGNSDFMHGGKTWPVRYTLVPVPHTADFYGVQTCRWAEADIGQAASILKEIDRTERSSRKG